MAIHWGSVKNSSESKPDSRPMPERFIPPNGIFKSRFSQVLTQTKIQWAFQIRNSFHFEKVGQIVNFLNSPLFAIFQNRSNMGLFGESSVENVILWVSLRLKWSTKMIFRTIQWPWVASFAIKICYYSYFLKILIRVWCF